MEEWKQIKDYSNYEISNTGVIKTTKNEFTRKEKILKRKKSNNGYVRVGLWKNNKVSFKSVHRLVAIHFIPNPDNLPEVNHKDGDKENCNDWNLEWNTHEQNINHAIENSLSSSGERNGRAKLTYEQVEEIKKSSLSQRKLANIYNVCQTSIGRIKTGKGWK